MESNKNTPKRSQADVSRARKGRLRRNLLRGVGTVLDLFPTQESTALFPRTVGTEGSPCGVEVAYLQFGVGGNWRWTKKTLYPNDFDAIASDWSSVGADITTVLSGAKVVVADSKHHLELTEAKSDA